MKKPMKKMAAKAKRPMPMMAKKSPTKDMGRVKMGAMRGGSPGDAVPGGSGRGGPESLPASFGGGRVTDRGKK